MTTPLRAALHDAADAITETLDRMDKKLDLILAAAQREAEADARWPLPPVKPKAAKPLKNGHNPEVKS